MDNSNFLDAFKPTASDQPAIVQYNELTGDTYYRVLVGGVDADNNWVENGVIRIPGVYLQFPNGKETLHVNYAMTESDNDPVRLLGWEMPSEDLVANLGGQLKAFKQPSKTRNYIPVVICGGPKDKSLTGKPVLLAISDAQMTTLRKEIAKLGDSTGGPNDPKGRLLRFTVDAKAKAPKDKYIISMAANDAVATDEEYANALKVLNPLYMNAVMNETRLCGGPNVYLGDPDAAAANVWAHIEQSLGLTKEQIIDRFYVGMNPRVNPTGEAFNNPETDFA